MTVELFDDEEDDDLDDVLFGSDDEDDDDLDDVLFGDEPETDASAEAKPAALAAGEPMVRRMQRKLQAAFVADGNQLPAQDAYCFDVIKRFLLLTGWLHRPRQLSEAMPHADTIECVAAFRGVLHKLGFRSTCEPASPRNLRPEFLPCFVRQHDGKIILVEKEDATGGLVVYDPQTEDHGKLAPNEITGDAIFPEAIDRDAAAAPKSLTRQIFTAFRPLLGQLFATSFAVNLMALVPPLFVMMVYDKAVAAKSHDVLIGLTIGMAVIALGDFLLRQSRVQLQSYLGARLDEQLNEIAFSHLLHLPLSHTEDAPIGAQLSRLRQMTTMSEAFTGPLANAVIDLPFLVLFLSVIAMVGGPLVFIPVGLIVAYVVLGVWALPKLSLLIKEAGDHRSLLQSLTMECVAAQRTIYDLWAEHIWIQRQRRQSAQTVDAAQRARRMTFIVQTVSQSFVTIAGVLVLTIGAIKVIGGTLSAGGLIAVMALCWRVLGPIQNLFLSGLTLSQTRQSFLQLDRLTRMPLERDPGVKPTIPRQFKGHLRFDSVSFRYPGAREPSLRGVSFDAKPGELVCIYGNSGAGASTVLRLLLGLYQPQAGIVSVDGLDLRQIDKGEWRQAIAVSPQKPDLFHGTVAQNVQLARPDATPREINALARELGLDSYFGTSLPEGIDTRCSSMARANWPDALLSRIVLMRTFIKKAPVYLLDEPVAALDREGEAAFLRLLEARRNDSAILMVTQRPSHLRMASRVLWLEAGRMRGFGPPEEVLPMIFDGQAASSQARGNTGT